MVALAEAETVPAPRAAVPGPRPWASRWWVALVGAIVAGFVLYAAFPPVGLWFLAPVGVALLALATHRRGFWLGALLGFLTGLTLQIPLLHWAGGYVGAVWLFLPVGESFFFALMGGLAAVATPVVTRWRWSWPLVTGALWVLQESLRDRQPFGGFPWGRLAFSQADSPLLRLAALGGAPLVTFGVGVAGGLLALAVTAVPRPARAGQDPRPEPERGKAWRWSAGALVLALGGVWTPLAVPTAATDAGTVNIAIVQGNVPRLGLDFNAQRRAVLDNHVRATLQLAQEVKAGTRPQPDFVIWPENASDVDPLKDVEAGNAITTAAQAIGVPILVGAVLEGPDDAHVLNDGIVWDPVTGPGASYQKEHPVPFGEYMPLRPLVRMITSKADLVREDFVPGHTPGVLTMGTTARGFTTIGDVICFEVAYDNIVRDTVLGGASVLVVQTNNATFNDAEAEQQLAMVRLRAVEHGRPALMASTVGVSAFIDATGKVYDATQFNAEAVIDRDMALGNRRTMATVLGLAPELVLALAAVGVVIFAIVLRCRPAPMDRRVED